MRRGEGMTRAERKSERERERKREIKGRKKQKKSRVEAELKQIIYLSEINREAYRMERM